MPATRAPAKPADQAPPRAAPRRRACRAGMLAAGFVLWGAGAAHAQLQKMEPPAIPVIAAQAATACFSEAIHANGLLAPRTEAVVMLTLEGYAVAEIFAAEGDSVTEGQPLVRVARIESNTPEARAAAAAQAAAQGQTQPALPASIVLRAPAAGTVIASRAAIGAAASPRGEPLFRLAVDGFIEAVADIVSPYLPEVKPEQSARIDVEDGRVFTGRVRRIDAEIDPLTQMGRARVALERDASLRSGRLVRATIDARHSCGVSIPRSAVSYSTDGTSVQVVRGRVIETVRVRVGLSDGGAVEIEAGLHAGDLVVANAGASLRDGDIVAPTIAPGETSAAERP